MMLSKACNNFVWSRATVPWKLRNKLSIVCASIARDAGEDVLRKEAAELTPVPIGDLAIPNDAHFRAQEIAPDYNAQKTGMVPLRQIGQAFVVHERRTNAQSDPDDVQEKEDALLSQLPSTPSLAHDVACQNDKHATEASSGSCCAGRAVGRRAADKEPALPPPPPPSP